jgi:hypothetical protein
VISPKESKEWVSEYSFIARDEASTYHVEFVRRKPKEGPGEFTELFTWNMSFAPLETRTLAVQYRIPMTMGLISTRKDDNTHRLPAGPLEQELLNIGMEEVVGYITSTGSSWAGNVESAKFTVITEPFERYLDVRGMGEEPQGDNDEKQDEDAARDREAFPVRHPWWFRTISPAGWKAVDRGVQWTYKDYKPKDSIVICYYMTEFPRLPEEVSPFVDQFLKNLSAADPAVDLGRLKQLLLATYGKEPEDEVVKQHVSGQLWYQPHKEFRMESLSKTQKAMLDQLDVRIAKAQGTQNPPKN